MMSSQTSQRFFSTNETRDEKIDFGFKQVDLDDKQKMVGGVFSNVADSYDVMNDAMSLGVHRIWKNEFVSSIGPLKKRKILDENLEVVESVPLKILDVAGGTGDISFKILEKARQDDPTGLSVDITVSDINADMLEVGKKRAVEQGIFHDLQFKVLNAQELEGIESDSMDLYTIAFGIRNVTDRALALKEAHRVLRKGGRFMCLEFSEVIVPGFK